MVLRLLNPRHRLARWPLKTLFLAAVLVLVCYPNPRLLVRHIQHWRDPGALIEPDHPALAELAAEVEAKVAEAGVASNPPEVLRIVHRAVVKHIPYAWDWDTWGCSDYMPTVSEIMAKGREDCDGRAVIAASLLKRLGYDARLLTDGSHVWVWTPKGETMSPMPTSTGRTLVQVSDTGSSVDLLALVHVRALTIDWPKNIGYGVAVFPAIRVAVIGAAVLLVWLPVRARAWRAALAVLLVLGGLLVWKAACSDPWHNSLTGAWAGLGLCGLGLVSAARSGVRPGLRSTAESPLNSMI